MNISAHSFSAQYLRQVHDEWLYVESVRRSREGAGPANADDPGEAAYCFRALAGGEGNRLRAAGG